MYAKTWLCFHCSCCKATIGLIQITKSLLSHARELQLCLAECRTQSVGFSTRSIFWCPSKRVLSLIISRETIAAVPIQCCTYTSFGEQACTRKTRLLDVVYNASNNELVRPLAALSCLQTAGISLPFCREPRRGGANGETEGAS